MTKLPRPENPSERMEVLSRIVASHLSGIHHDDVIADEDIDNVIAGKLINYIDKLFDEMFG